MIGNNTQELTPILRPDINHEGVEFSNETRIPIPNENLLQTGVQNRSRLNLLSENNLVFLSGAYGYFLGDAIAAFGSPEKDGWSIVAGVGVTVISMSYIYRALKYNLEGNQRLECAPVIKHSLIYGLFAAAGAVLNWEQTYCTA